MFGFRALLNPTYKLHQYTGVARKLGNVRGDGFIGLAVMPGR